MNGTKYTTSAVAFTPDLQKGDSAGQGQTFIGQCEPLAARIVYM